MDYMNLVLLLLFRNVLAGGWIFPTKKNVCYDSLGCFTVKHPFTNTRGLLPRSPEIIGVKFLLFTRNTSMKYQELVLSGKEKKCQWRSFCKYREVKLIIHGYMDHVGKPWVRKMVKALLKQGNYNIIVVDWRNGAREVNYYQSAANIRVVGAQVSQLLKIFKRIYGIEPGAIHIIGHSLGAHAAGYVGEYLEGIGRITGLDPAGPAFRSEDDQVRLDSNDARFVDAIHTDGELLFTLGFGLMTPVGTVDFYPNGGKDQPGCPTSYYAQLGLLFTGDFAIVKNVACSHLRAIDLFIESINPNCTHTAYPCEQINADSKTNCTTCNEGCGIMGYHTDVAMAAGKYYLNTTDSAPFCDI